MSSYLFIGGPAHGKEMAVETSCFHVEQIDHSAPDYRCNHPDHPPIFLPTKRTTYARRTLGKTYHTDALRRFGSYAMYREVMVPIDMRDDEAMAKLQEYLLDTFLGSGRREAVSLW